MAASRLCVAGLAAEFGEFPLEVVEGGVVLAAATGGHVLDEAGELDEGGWGGVAVDDRHGRIPFRLRAGRSPPGWVAGQAAVGCFACSLRALASACFWCMIQVSDRKSVV